MSLLLLGCGSGSADVGQPPDDFSDLSIWAKADGRVIESGGLISEMGELGFDQTIESTGEPNKPLLVSSGGLLAAQFDGIDDGIFTPFVDGDINMSGAFTLIVVGTSEKATAGVLFSQGGGSTSGTVNIFFQVDSDAIVGNIARPPGGRSIYVSNAPPDHTGTQDKIFRLQCNGTNATHEIFVNSVLAPFDDDLGFNTDPSSSKNDQVFVFLFEDNVSHVMGLLREFILFTAFKSAAEVARIELYLATKWAAVLP